MTDPRWGDLDRVFTEALRRPPGERAAFVAHASGADEVLREEALRLLRAHEVSGAFMTTSALDTLAVAMASEGIALAPGARIGAYTILDRLGAGGSGEVWRARDDRLGRDVAIKTLLPLFRADAERLRRFGDEARAAGALNHPSILTVHDVGEHRGVPFLVTECLEGRSLRQRLASSERVGAAEGVAVALGIARGLAAAHARGIVHRDLKPENVFLRPDGGVKILDFGLATLGAAPERPPGDPSRTTATGVVAGTAGYMAPEQAMGRPVDARADLFALGVIAYEMLSGRHPFRRASAFETAQAVLTVEPAGLASVAPQVPDVLARIVMRLLEKSPEARFQTASDLIWTLDHVAGVLDRRSEVSRSHAATPSAARRRLAFMAMPVMAAALALAGGSWLIERWRAPAPVALTRLTLSLPAGVVLDSAPAVSPDSRHIAFVGRDAAGARLFVRALATDSAMPIAGTQGAAHPFWAPDGGSLGFFTGGQLWKVAWPGGAPVALAAAPMARGGTWSRSDVILFAPDVILAGLGRVRAGGGEREPATLLEVERGDTSHWWPVFLPDGERFLYSVRSVDDARRGVYLGRLGGPASRAHSPLLRSESQVVHVALPGTEDAWLLYGVEGRVEARLFDGERSTVAPDALALPIAAGEGTLYHPLMLGASVDLLAFAASAIPSGDRLACVTRSGEQLHLWDEAEAQNWPRISPDGRRLARQRVDALQNNPDLWVEDLERGTRVRVTTAVEPDLQPAWSPDGRYLAYVSGSLPGRAGERVLHIAAADGTGSQRTLRCPAPYCEATDWSRDGDVLLVNARDGRSRGDVWTMSASDGAARPLLAESYAERDARFSPDGRWVAYVSEESGRPEVSVQRVAGPPERIVVSGGGGDQPVWRRDGEELFFVDPRGRLQSARVRWAGDGVPRFDTPAELHVPPIGFGHWGTQYDVSPDGSRVYLLQPNDDPPPREIHVVMGWRELLDQRGTRPPRP